MGSKEVDIEAMVEGRGGETGEERILSIVLSTSELAKLDLSNIQLFQANEAHGNSLCINSDPDPFSFLAGSACPTDPVVFKSRAVMEAETTRHESPPGCPTRHGCPPGSRTRRPAPIPGIRRSKNHPAVPLPEPHEVSKPRIDLKSSPASKFLVQVMPWELQPSPVTPFPPVAVPFGWEEVPGRPKSRVSDRRSPCPVLHLPPRLLPQKGLNGQCVGVKCPGEDPGTRHRRSGSSGSAEEKRVISIEGSHKNPGCILSCVDCNFPSSVTDGCSEPKGSMWRKNSSSKHERNGSGKNNKQRSLNPSGELLIQREDHELWVFEEGRSEEGGNRYQSLNGMIAAAMGAQTEDLGFSKSTAVPYSKNMRPSSIMMNAGFSCPKMPGRTKRKWVLRKLRRPARLFKSFFSAVWRSVWVRKSRHNSIGNSKHSYQSLSR